MTQLFMFFEQLVHHLLIWVSVYHGKCLDIYIIFCMRELPHMSFFTLSPPFEGSASIHNFGRLVQPSTTSLSGFHKWMTPRLILFEILFVKSSSRLQELNKLGSQQKCV